MHILCIGDVVGSIGCNFLAARLPQLKKQYDIDKIREAFLYAKALHEGQMRQSGEPYITHPVAVASILAELELDTDSICAALLHDTLEDCSSKQVCIWNMHT